MNYEKIVTLYDTADHAESARRRLEAAGFLPSDISLVSKKTLNMTGQTLQEPGLWRRFFGREIEQHEATVYGRGVESGGVVLTVRVAVSEAPRAMGILNAYNAVDVRERAVQLGLISTTSAPSTPKVDTMPAASRPETFAAGVGRDEVLRLAEEQLDVGKRLVQEGATRIRRFVTEKPVEAQVTLHEEHVKLVRRAVTDPEFVKDIDWTDKTIEVTETIEEAVVTKSAHIAEEVVIRKEGKDHTQTVHDKVRRQEIAVEHIPTSQTTRNG